MISFMDLMSVSSGLVSPRRPIKTLLELTYHSTSSLPQLEKVSTKGAEMSHIQAKFNPEEQENISIPTDDAETSLVLPDEDECFMTPLNADGETTRKTPARKRTRLFTDADDEEVTPAAKRRKHTQDEEMHELLAAALRNFSASDNKFGHFGSYIASLCTRLEETQSKLEALGEIPRMHLLEVKEKAISLFNRQILENLELIRQLGGSVA